MVVEGHTDSQGSDDLNLKLSEDRAAAVRDYLVSRGVAADRLSAVGVGEKRPIADNTSAEGRANNRRVEIVIASASAPTSKPGG
jgi:outer membrane protein OmpA-like peptidoglycan-associated protein